MKKYYISAIQLVAIFSLSLLLMRCKDEDEIRFEMDDVQEGVNFRVQRSVAQFDASDPASQVELTYYSENNDISKVQILTDYYSLLNDETSDRFLLEEIDGSTITNDGSSTNVITLQQLKDAVGLTNLAGGDQFNIYHVVHLADGRIYPDTIDAGGTKYVNVESGVLLATTSSFTPQLSFPISCPIDDQTFATGSYLFEVIEGNNASAFGNLYGHNQVVTVEATSGTVRKFKVPYLYQAVAGFESTVTFEFACNVVLVAAQGTGLGCGIGLTIVQNPGSIGTFDLSNDSMFTIGIFHNVDNDCGLPPNQPLKFRLTKQ